MTRVQIPAYADSWMRGDRFGEITKTLNVEPTTAGDRYAYRNCINSDGTITMAWVKMDISKRTLIWPLDECTIVD